MNKFNAAFLPLFCQLLLNTGQTRFILRQFLCFGCFRCDVRFVEQVHREGELLHGEKRHHLKKTTEESVKVGLRDMLQ